MDLTTHEYSLSYVSILLPESFRSDQNIKQLRLVSNDESKRLKDGIEVGWDELSQMKYDCELDKEFSEFIDYVVKHWENSDIFIFTL